MRIEFADDHLAQILTREAHRLGLPIAIVNLARRRLLQLEFASDERDLRKLKGLNYKKRKGDLAGQRSIRINKQYRIFFTLSDDARPPVITVTFIGDPH